MSVTHVSSIPLPSFDADDIPSTFQERANDLMKGENSQDSFGSSGYPGNEGSNWRRNSDGYRSQGGSSWRGGGSESWGRSGIGSRGGTGSSGMGSSWDTNWDGRPDPWQSDSKCAVSCSSHKYVCYCLAHERIATAVCCTLLLLVKVY